MRAKKPAETPRWRAGRKPVMVTLTVWQATRAGYLPMEARYGYVTNDELRGLLRTVKPLTTPLVSWANQLPGPSRSQRARAEARSTEEAPEIE